MSRAIAIKEMIQSNNDGNKDKKDAAKWPSSSAAHRQLKAQMSTQDKLNLLDSTRNRFQGKGLPLNKYAAEKYQRLMAGIPKKGQNLKQTW